MRLGRGVMGATLGGTLVVASLVTTGCGSSSSGDDDGLETIISADYSVEPGEKYYCMRKTVDEEIDISAFEAIAPPGLHHTTLSWGDPNGANGGPDGLTECGEYEHHFQNLGYESGSHEDRFDLPAGLAARVHPGDQLLLNFHILNATNDTLSGTTGTRILRVDPSEVEHFAKSMYMGKVSLSVPPGTSTQVGHCPLPNDLTVVAIEPHMHSHGTHEKVVCGSSMVGDETIFDEDFDFSSSMYYRNVDPEVPMKKDDVVEVDCTYNNDTGMNLPWGPGSWTTEMCFGAVYVYPEENVPSTACAD